MIARAALVFLVLGLSIAPSATAKLRATTTPGVSVSKGPGGRVTIHFAATRAGVRPVRR